MSFLVLALIQLSFHEPADKAPQRILIYWDTSFSMNDRSLELEFKLLSDYFRQMSEVRVDFLTFDHELGKGTSFDIDGGQWESLRSKISGLHYDGIALYDVLDYEGDYEQVLIFSDGNPVLDQLKLPLGKQVYLISSVTEKLEVEGLSNHVNYLNLHLLGVSRILQRLGLEERTVTSQAPSGQPESGEALSLAKNDGAPVRILIEGIIYDQGNPLSGATVSIKGEDRGVVSGKDGRFEIEVKMKEILLIGFLGMENQEYQIGGDEFLEIYLNSKSNELEEVILKARNEPANKISTAFGEINEDKIGYAVQTIEDDVFEGQSNISDATRGKIISYNYAQNDDLSQIQLRQVQTFGFGTKNPLIVIDDIPFGVNNSASGNLNFSTYHIDPNNVEKITVLRGLAATNKYGTLGRGGAILIYTKTRVGATGESAEKTNSAMLKGNVYNESVSSIQSKPTQDYLKELKKAGNAQEAYAVYLDQRSSYRNDLQYFVNVSKSMVRWGDAKISKRILLNGLEIDPESAENFRSTAMFLQDRKDFAMAEMIYQKLVKLRPEEAQSYRDLALVYTENQKYQEALEIYMKIKNKEYPQVSFDGLKKTVNSEMKRLLLLHKAKLNTYGLSSHYSTPLNYDVRVVMDWNDRNSEFELQFVNPQKKFFVWSHSRANNALRMEQERAEGFNTEEFLLIDAESGKWQINIESKKNKSMVPQAFRYTVYRNYARSDETRESKTVFLNDVDGKYLLGIIKI